MLTILGAVTLSIFFFIIFSTELASEEGESMPDISGDRSLRDRDYNPEQVQPLSFQWHINAIVICAKQDVENTPKLYPGPTVQSWPSGSKGY